MKSLVSIICVIFLSCNSASFKVRYDNYKVYRFIPENEGDRNILLTLEQENPGVLFWKGVRNVGQPVDIMFPPHLQYELLSNLRNKNISVSVFIDDVQSLMDREMEEILRADALPKLTWTAYHNTAAIYQFLGEQAALHPTKAQVLNVGRSFEGRDLKLIKISKGGGNTKPIIWLDANIHAREWITNAIATYLINELLNSNDAAISKLTEDYDWYIMPMLNPDGYEYSRTTDRMWRKTRSTTSSPMGCRGADPNRNWGFRWMSGGASNNPCSDTYGGSAVFSEPENRQTSQFITTIASRTVFYLSLHSYSQLILLPFGHNNIKIPEYNEYMRIGRLAATALARRYGTRFTPGNIVDLLYVASGGSMDWVKGTYNTQLTYTFEMRDTGRYGFILPPNQILPSALEFIDSLLVMVAELRRGNLKSA